MPIVMALTPSYLVPACVCVFSILENSDSDDSFHVVLLLTERLNIDERKALESLCSNRLSIEFLDMENIELDIYIDERFTIAASYRLLLPELLPSLNKVIYIDCDIVVRQNLYKVYQESNITNYYLAGVYEATLDSQVDYVRSLGCDPGKYFNSGFLIMNLEKLREHGMVTKFLQYAKCDQLQFPDQDVLNQLCKDYFLPISPVYNSIRTCFIEKYKYVFLKYYYEEQWLKVQSTGNIHYTGGKPWSTYTIKFDTWWSYYYRLPDLIQKRLIVNRLFLVFVRLYMTAIGKKFVEFLRRLYKKMSK